MKPLLSFGALVLSILVTTISAEAAWVGGDFGNFYVTCPPYAVCHPQVEEIEQPRQRHEKARHPAPIHHVAIYHVAINHVAKRPKPQQRDEDEKAPAAVAPPALPLH